MGCGCSQKIIVQTPPPVEPTPQPEPQQADAGTTAR